MVLQKPPVAAGDASWLELCEEIPKHERQLAFADSFVSLRDSVTAKCQRSFRRCNPVSRFKQDFCFFSVSREQKLKF